MKDEDNQNSIVGCPGLVFLFIPHPSKGPVLSSPVTDILLSGAAGHDLVQYRLLVSVFAENATETLDILSGTSRAR